MPVAKSYAKCDILGEPFTKNGRKYVTIETPFGGIKNVRWYSDAEYARMYPNATKGKPSYREILGFGEAGYITIYYGETYPNLAWFKERPECRYHKVFGWYTPSNETVCDEIPEGIQTAVIQWNDVKNSWDEVDEDKATALIAELKYADVPSGEFVGEIGDRIEFELKIKKAITLTGMYGISTMHVMEDENGNTFIWTTASKTLEVGTTYRMKGTIKDHKEYKGVKQTVLTRCTLLKNKE